MKDKKKKKQSKSNKYKPMFGFLFSANSPAASVSFSVFGAVDVVSAGQNFEQQLHSLLLELREDLLDVFLHEHAQLLNLSVHLLELDRAIPASEDGRELLDVECFSHFILLRFLLSTFRMGLFRLLLLLEIESVQRAHQLLLHFTRVVRRLVLRSYYSRSSRRASVVVTSIQDVV